MCQLNNLVFKEEISNLDFTDIEYIVVQTILYGLSSTNFYNLFVDKRLKKDFFLSFWLFIG